MKTSVKKPLASIIIINYETYEATIDLVKSLGKNDSVEILIIDNSNSDVLNKELTKRKVDYVRYYHLKKNRGYAGAINAGIQQSQGEWIMILNNDTITSIRNILRLISSAKKKGCTVAVPKLSGKNGDIQNNIGYFDDFFTHPINFLFARPRIVNASNIKKPCLCDVATGGAILFHKSIIKKIGSWDDTFFMYFEDIDFCYRLYKAQTKILYEPTVAITHTESLTTNRDPVQKMKNYSRSRNLYLIKHRGYISKVVNDLFKIF